jgi:release factor glutamine methyltransferase
MTVQEALDWASSQLVNTSEAELAAKMLLAHVLNCSTTDLFAHPERALATADTETYCQLISRRARHEPVAYLVGHRAFFDVDVIVDRRALIPRPETEHLVERALHVARRWRAPKIADVGTGSGAVAVCLAGNLSQAHIFATDQSADALQLARENARRLGVAAQIVFLQGNLLAPLVTPVHLIVANLPYVSESEYDSLPPDIRGYEPRRALVAGEDGLDAIRALLDTARSHLTADGVLLLEIGTTQGLAVATLARRALPGAHVVILPDYAGHDRVVQIAVE